MVGLRQDEFDWALKRVSVLTENGLYCKKTTYDFFRCCGIGTDRIAQASQFAKRHKCKNRRWVRFGPEETLHDNIMCQLNSVDAMPPRCNDIYSIRRELKEKVRRCMDKERQRLTNNEKEYKTNESKAEQKKKDLKEQLKAYQLARKKNKDGFLMRLKKIGKTRRMDRGKTFRGKYDGTVAHYVMRNAKQSTRTSVLNCKRLTVIY